MLDFYAKCKRFLRRVQASSSSPMRSIKRQADIKTFSYASSLAAENPPTVDIVIHNLHSDGWGTARAARPFPVEVLLAHMLTVIARRRVRLHSVAATAFSVTLVIDDPLVSPDRKSFHGLVNELVDNVDGSARGGNDKDDDFFGEEDGGGRILGERRTTNGAPLETSSDVTNERKEF